MAAGLLFAGVAWFISASAGAVAERTERGHPADGAIDRDRSSPAKFRLGDEWRVGVASWREASDSDDALRDSDETEFDEAELEKPPPIDPILTQLGGLDFGVER